ncbi:MAG: protein kinase [Candidatus Acidiferrales bacterium]
MAITSTDGPPTVRVDMGEQLGRPIGTLTVLFVDALSAALTEHRNDASNRAKGDSQFEEVISILQRHQSTAVKTIRDSLMAEFSDPVSAVRAGVEILRGLQQANLLRMPGEQLEARIGIHAVEGSSGIEAFAGVVNEAVRITKRAAARQILVSRSVYESASRESDLHCQWLDKLAVDGREEDVFEVSWTEAPSNVPARYEVLSHIGTGGMGMVYKVRDLQTNEIVALKVLKPGLASDPAMQEILRKEVCLARKVTHKNVCRIHEFNRSNGTASISMEFVEGESLSSRLRRLGPIPVDEALELGRQICAGLHEAHLQAIVHRDLKPANIIVDRSSSVKIMDFGIARVVREDSHMTGTIAGTPAYMAPEQVGLQRVDARTDIYAVGLLLYEMVTGIPAFSGDNPIATAVMQLREPPKRPREIIQTLTADVEAVILKCLQKEPDKRFQSVDELELALRKEEEASPVADRWDSIVPRLQQAGFAVQEILSHGVERAKPAFPWCASKLRQVGIESKRIGLDAARRIRVFVQERDWGAMTAVRFQQALAGLGLVILVGCAIAFGLGLSGNSKSASIHSSALAPVQSRVAEQGTESGQGIDAAADGATAPPTHPVDLNSGSDSRSVNTSPLNRSTSRTNSTQSKNSRLRSSNAKQPTRVQASSTTTATADEMQTADFKLDTSLAAPVAATPTAKPADSGNFVVGAPGSTLTYLEVGSSKDSAWADSAKEKLSELGFRAVSQRKGHLWVQSYHVEVGPYADPKELEAAQQNLAAHGFKSHPVK